MHDRNAGLGANATRTPFPLIYPAQVKSKYVICPVWCPEHDPGEWLPLAPHAMRGAHQSCERLPAHPVASAEGSFLVSEGILSLCLTACFVRFRKATHSACVAMNGTKCEPPD